MERESSAESDPQLARFWMHIYGEQCGFIALLSARRSGKSLSMIRSTYFPYPDRISSASFWIAAQQSQERELYQAAHLVSTRLRRKATALRLQTLYVDLDDGRLTSDVPSPTLVVESSPRRLHCYWKLDRLVAPADGEQLNRRLALALGGDRSGWDLTQLLRIPGTTNHKYAGAPLVRVVNETIGSYDPQELEESLPPAPAPDPAVHANVGSDEPGLPLSLPVELADDDRLVWEGRTVKRRQDGGADRSASLLPIAAVLFDAGLRGDAIAARLAWRTRCGLRLLWRHTTTARARQPGICELVRGFVSGGSHHGE